MSTRRLTPVETIRRVIAPASRRAGPGTARAALAAAVVGAAAATGIGLTPFGIETAGAATASAGSAGSYLYAGQTLQQGQYLTSSNGQYQLIMQGDGNLVEYMQGHALWNSGTSGHAGAYAVMQGDGNLVVYQGSTPLWNAGTGGHLTGNYYLAVQSDANVVVYAPGGSPLWATHTVSDSLWANTTLTAGQYLTSSNGQYRLIMQGDGNLVEYNAAGAPLWAPPPPNGTYGHAGAYAVLQGDGNFVVYPTSGAALWASYTQNNPGDHLTLQADGNLVTYSAAGAPLWATMSGADPRGATTTGNYYPGGQCTWYAEQEAAQYTGLWLKSFGNAMNWAGNAAASGWAVGATPRIGSVIVFQPGVDGAGGVGHVAFVTNYYPSTGRVVISEMNFTGLGQVDTRTITNGSNNPGIRYIYVNP